MARFAQSPKMLLVLLVALFPVGLHAGNLATEQCKRIISDFVDHGALTEEEIKSVSEKIAGNVENFEYPGRLMRNYLDAQTVALNAFHACGYQLKQAIMAYLIDVVQQRQRIDPYKLFLFLAESEKVISPNCRHNNLKAFMLMARALMNAPYTRSNIDEKLRFTIFVSRYMPSFLYLAELAEHWPDMLKYESAENNVVDAWQIYFQEYAFLAHAATWALPLYFFYWNEAHFLDGQDDPFANPVFFDVLEARLALGRKYYFSPWDPLEEMNCPAVKDFEKHFLFLKEIYLNSELDENQRAQKERELFDKVGGEYVVVDVNVYWRLMFWLVGKDQLTIDRYFKLMDRYGADRQTIIDGDGNTAHSLSLRLGVKDFASQSFKREPPTSLSGNPQKKIKKEEEIVAKPAKRYSRINPRISRAPLGDVSNTSGNENERPKKKEVLINTNDDSPKPSIDLRCYEVLDIDC